MLSIERSLALKWVPWVEYFNCIISVVYDLLTYKISQLLVYIKVKMIHGTTVNLYMLYLKCNPKKKLLVVKDVSFADEITKSILSH